MTVGDKIAKLRRDNNLTQEQLADILRVSRQSVSKWESNLSFPDTEKLIRISKLYSCSIDYLLKEEIDIIGTEVEPKVTQNEYQRGMVLVVLSYPPICGIYFAFLSIKYQLNIMHNKGMIIGSIVGMIVSFGLTLLMILGFMFEL